MIFEETTWANNDHAKDLEALLFAVPDNLKNRPSEQLCLQDMKSNIIGKPGVKKRGAVQRKIRTPTDTSKETGKTHQFIKHKAPIPVPKSTPVTKISTDKHIRIASTVKADAKKNQSDKFKILSSLPKSTGGKSQMGSVTTRKKEQMAEHSMPHKSDWRKRAFSKLLQEGAFPQSRPTQKTGNVPQSFAKAGTLHDAKRRKVKQDTSAADTVHSVTRKPTDDMVHNPKRRKVEQNISAASTLVLTESRSVALNRAVTSKLMAAQFRFINEQLYTRSSKEAKKLFTKDNKLFQVYHDGYSQQISRWPSNPLDAIISFIQKKPSNWVIGDFGCGDARLARSVKNKVHSFDLVACNDTVTVADIAHVPLPNESLDAAVLCLSLMGTNFVDFISEANRTLKMRGTLLIAEIESRFKNVLKFKNLMKNMGFQLKKEEKNSYFISFNFMKTRSPNREFKTAAGLLKPCVYKKR